MSHAQIEALRRQWQRERDAFRAAYARGETEIQRIIALLEYNSAQKKAAHQEG